MFLSAFREYPLARGQLGVVPLIAADRVQAREVLNYVRGIVDGSPLLSKMVRRRTASSVQLGNVVIEVRTCSWRLLRGMTACAAICDETLAWHQEGSANPDREVLAALRPALLTTKGLLVGISSPRLRRGIQYDAFSQHHGVDHDPVLSWRAASTTMNPALDVNEIQRQLDDPATSDDARCEYLAEWATHLDSYVNPEVVAACTDVGCAERPRLEDVGYYAFCDMAGGSGSDAAALCVAHHEKGSVIVDKVVARKPPFSPESVVAGFCDVLREYGIGEVVGDRFSGLFAPESFQRHGVAYKQSEHPARVLFGALLPLLNSERIRLVDDKVANTEICRLERKVTPAGNTMIQAPPREHDDRAVCIAGAASLTMASQDAYIVARNLRDGLPAEFPHIRGENGETYAQEAARRLRDERTLKGFPLPGFMGGMGRRYGT